MLANPKRAGAMDDDFLGPSYTDDSILSCLAQREGISYFEIDERALCTKTAALLAEGNIVGWFQGRMEYGPRALGNRSILADPRNTTVRDRINKDVKFREDFRPFAPAVLEEFSKDYFALEAPSPYMLFTSFARKELPAVTHVDGSARVQTVGKDTNQKFYRLLQAFYEQTHCPALVNTSYNVRGEPIVMTPQDALDCFLDTGMDYLVLGNILVSKSVETSPSRRVFDLD
jgi:carbamoyltransferase